MAIAKIQTGDTVKVISGSYKGTVGQVLKIFKKKDVRGVVTSVRAIISNIPKIVKYKKANRAYSVAGSQNEVDRKISISNLSLTTSNGDLSRVKIEEKDGKKLRILKKDNSIVVKKEILSSSKETLTTTSETQSEEAVTPKVAAVKKPRATSTKKSEK